MIFVILLDLQGLLFETADGILVHRLRTLTFINSVLTILTVFLKIHLPVIQALISSFVTILSIFLANHLPVIQTLVATQEPVVLGRVILTQLPAIQTPVATQEPIILGRVLLTQLPVIQTPVAIPETAVLGRVILVHKSLELLTKFWASLQEHQKKRLQRGIVT
jgi:hypothetical protein